MMQRNYQLAVELTDVFDAAIKASRVGKTAIDSARDLRKLGSDILAEEDLAEMFGRGTVLYGLEV